MCPFSTSIHMKMILRSALLAVQAIIGIFLNIIIFSHWIVAIPLYYIVYTISSITIHYKGYEQAEGCDVIHGRSTKESPAVINAVARMRGAPDVESARQNFIENVINPADSKGRKIYRKFTQIFTMCMGFYVWKEDPTFDIADHIYVVEHEILADDDVTEESWKKSVQNLMNKVGNTPLPPDKPQWQFILYRQTKSRFLVIFRVHHGICDGINLMRVIMELTLQLPVFFPKAIIMPSKFQRFVQKIWSCLFISYEIFGALSYKFMTNPLHGPKLSGTKRYFISKLYQMDELLQLKKEGRCSMNVLLYSGISYAMARHFHDKKKNVTSIGVLTPYVMVDPSKPVKLSNTFYISMVHLPTVLVHKTSGCIDSKYNEVGRPITALERLKNTRASLMKTKKNYGSLAFNMLIRWCNNLLLAKFSTFIAKTTGFTCCLSNVPGLTRRMEYWGGLNEELFFWAPDRQPHGVQLCLLSYNEKARLTLGVDQALMTEEEGERFIGFFEKFIQELKQEAISYTDTNQV